MADNRSKNISKVPACPKFLPKAISKIGENIPKHLPPPPPESLLFEGGGKIIKCRKRKKYLNMLSLFFEITH